MGPKSTPILQTNPGEIPTPTEGAVSSGVTTSPQAQRVRSIDLTGQDPTWVDTTVHTVKKTLNQARDQFDTAAEKLAQGKEKLTATYDRISHKVGDSYGKTAQYGRENPGRAGLMVFGAGVGIGVLLTTLLNRRR